MNIRYYLPSYLIRNELTKKAKRIQIYKFLNMPRIYCLNAWIIKSNPAGDQPPSIKRKERGGEFLYSRFQVNELCIFWFNLFSLFLPYSTLSFLNLPYSSLFFLILPYSSLFFLILPYSSLIFLNLPYSSSFFLILPYSSLFFLNLPYFPY